MSVGLHAVRARFSIAHSFRRRLFSVIFNPKVRKENEKHSAVRGDNVFESQRILAVRIKKNDVDHVAKNDDKLRHLEDGEVLLPPQVLLVRGSHRGQSVVRVHDHVDEGVDHCMERTEAAS